MNPGETRAIEEAIHTQVVASQALQRESAALVWWSRVVRRESRSLLGYARDIRARSAELRSLQRQPGQPERGPKPICSPFEPERRAA